ncbi:MAG: response regulator [Caulobacter sp.]|jgi:CheY-like chemotaxis protein|nr:response regulator [Caulobacter sp.]
MSDRSEDPAPLGPLVLIVEDEPLVRMLAHDVLAEAGFGVIEAVNAEEALVLLDARPDTAVLFSDVNMPGSLNGFGLARLAVLKWPRLAILVTSGKGVGTGDLPETARYLQKPYSPSALVEAVTRLLDGA